MPRTRYHIPRETVTVKRPRRVQSLGPKLLRKRNIVTESKKTVEVSRCGAPYWSSNVKWICSSLDGSFFQHSILCVTASGNEVPPCLEPRSGKGHVTTIPSRLWGVEKLCATPVANDIKLKFIEREISPTMMTLRLATGTFVTVMKGVVEITCTMKEAQYDVIVGLPWFRKYEPQVS